MYTGFLQAVILAILQGITEFLPVSSSGHLVLIRELFHWKDDGGLLFDTILHAGSFCAICLYFYRDIIGTIKICYKAVFRKKLLLEISTDEESLFHLRLPFLLILATLPVIIMAPFLKDFLAETAEGARNAKTVGFAMIATALLFLLCDLKSKQANKPMSSFLHSLIIGVFQIIALLPGASRSGWTTGAGILCGYSRKEALRFSFLMALPALFGAIVFNIKDMIKSAEETGSVLIVLTGFFISFITSLAAIHFCLKFFQTHKFTGFAIYLCVVGSLAIFLAF